MVNSHQSMTRVMTQLILTVLDFLTYHQAAPFLLAKQTRNKKSQKCPETTKKKN
jgi:hypothetical protein